MEIRRLDSSDSDRDMLVEMVKEFRADTSNYTVAGRFLDDDSNIIVAAMDEGRILGFVLSYRLKRYDGQNDMVYIHEVGVMEEYRNRGIGKGMINELKQLCRAESISKIFVPTNKSNMPAVRLYESTGVKASHEDDIIYWYNDF